MDVAGARYDIVKNVDTGQLVAEFIARWTAQAKLDIDPSLVNLRLVHRGPGKLTKDPTERKAAEEAATTLDPADTLEEAGVADGSWMVAEFATSVITGESQPRSPRSLSAS
jgi:hypothetical protein